MPNISSANVKPPVATMVKLNNYVVKKQLIQTCEKTGADYVPLGKNHAVVICNSNNLVQRAKIYLDNLTNNLFFRPCTDNPIKALKELTKTATEKETLIITVPTDVEKIPGLKLDV